MPSFFFFSSDPSLTSVAVVFITSNYVGNSEIMQGCKEAGIPAFGTLWDFVSYSSRLALHPFCLITYALPCSDRVVVLLDAHVLIVPQSILSAQH